MLLDTNLRALRRHFRFDSAEEAQHVLAAIARRSEPGMATAVAVVACSLRIPLLDWWVTVDLQAFSVAEFAPTRAGW
jgi:hypothetical protein